MVIDEIIKKLIERGIDIGTKDAVKSALQMLEADTSLVDDVYIGLKNKLNWKTFSRVDFDQRAVFLPQCLRNSLKCQADLTDVGYICKKCGSCCLPQILEEAERLGYKAYIVPGGSMVHNIVESIRPMACVGVGCYQELEEAIAKLGRGGIPTQAVPLLKDGCKDTEVEVERVIKTLRIEVKK
jgi:hypothetical protein